MISQQRLESNASEIRKLISKKYGLLQRFCDLSGLTRYKVKFMLLDSEDTQNQLRILIDQTEDGPIVGKELTDVDKFNIRQAIKNKYGSISSFCEKESYRDSYISRILSSKMIRKDSKRVKQILKILNL